MKPILSAGSLNWRRMLKMIPYQDNRNHIIEVLTANDLDCNDLGTICMADTMVLGNYIEEIVVSAISYHLMNNKDPEYRNGKLIISSASLSHGLSEFQEGKSDGKDTLNLQAKTQPSKDTEGEAAITMKPETKTESTIPESKVKQSHQLPH
ncbi:hypothetical protein F0562_013175 [Nyssa sinensis]|uniref:DUF7751 domain-containing protein n=1 Tax=Nyssa sinensis TaxID=561372 RepID=A0A5J4ZX35_9ASTE|nr:hypothetical protein F0562_013175 [Nyssa sinensis]